MIKFTMLVFLVSVLSGCLNGDANKAKDVKTFMQTMEFDEDEYGVIKITGTVKIGFIPFLTSDVHLDYVKTKDAPVYEVIEE